MACQQCHKCLHCITFGKSTWLPGDLHCPLGNNSQYAENRPGGQGTAVSQITPPNMEIRKDVAHYRQT